MTVDSTFHSTFTTIGNAGESFPRDAQGFESVGAPSVLREAYREQRADGDGADDGDNRDDPHTFTLQCVVDMPDLL
jgi:hypothetical protein